MQKELEKISNDLLLATSHIVEAGNILKDMPLSETKGLEIALYEIAYDMFALNKDLEVGLKVQRGINDKYKDGIDEIAGMI